MIQSCAHKVTSFLIHNDAINNEDYDVYLYGFETLIAFIVNISIILLIGFMFDKFCQTLLFLICYCSIRQFSGGYHANNYRNCLLVFILVFLTNIYVLSLLDFMHFNLIIAGITFVSYIGICTLSPIEHRNNPLSNREKRCYKKVVRYLVSIVFIFSIVSLNFQTTYEYALYSASSVVWIFIMLSLAILKKYSRVRKEE